MLSVTACVQTIVDCEPYLKEGAISHSMHVFSALQNCVHEQSYTEFYKHYVLEPAWCLATGWIS